GAADFDPDALAATLDGDIALLRVTDGRSAFDTSGWGPPGHYAAWLPAYCAQLVTRDPIGQPQYRLLEPGQGDAILHHMKERRVGSTVPRRRPRSRRGCGPAESSGGASRDPRPRHPGWCREPGESREPPGSGRGHQPRRAGPHPGLPVGREPGDRRLEAAHRRE